jgi:hypothetical protein
MPDEQNRTAEALAGVNLVLTQVTPLIGIGIATLRGVIGLLRASGQPVATFEAEIVEYEAARARVQAAIDDFYRLFPPAPPAPGVTPTP